MAIPDTEMWMRGVISHPWWQLEHRILDYQNEPFNDVDTLQKWRSLGFSQPKFTGDMYDMRRAEPDWINPFRQYFDLRHFSWSVYRMGPGTVLPLHKDTYKKFKQVHELPSNEQILRIIVFLEDWQSGHYLEMNGTPVVQWRCGEWVAWRDQFPHLAANMGDTNRYTLQLTGV
jgi:hypothetical protein